MLDFSSSCSSSFFPHNFLCVFARIIYTTEDKDGPHMLVGWHPSRQVGIWVGRCTDRYLGVGANVWAE